MVFVVVVVEQEVGLLLLLLLLLVAVVVIVVEIEAVIVVIVEEKENEVIINVENNHVVVKVVEVVTAVVADAVVLWIIQSFEIKPFHNSIYCWWWHLVPEQSISFGCHQKQKEHQISNKQLFVNAKSKYKNSQLPFKK